MKFSRFNNIVKHKDNYIYYNALTNSFLHINPFIVDLINKAQAFNSLSVIYDVHPELYEVLEENKFIVDNDVDEILQARNLINSINGSDKSYRLIVNPTINCNFNCWYCYEDHTQKTKMTSEVLSRIEKLINNINSNESLEKFQLSFFGGEPLLQFKKTVVPLLTYAYKNAKIHNKYFFSDLTTNGFLLTDKILTELRKYNVESFQITLDGNKENHDKTRFTSKGRGSYDIIINNIINAVKKEFEIVLRVNYTAENLVGIEDMLDSFGSLSYSERKRITLSMNKVWQESNTNLGHIVDEFKNKALEFGFKLPDALLGNRVCNSCYADKINEAVINYDGNVYKCNARDFTLENREGVLDESGKIIWNERYYKRLTSKLTNKPCFHCPILPICGGGCSQTSLEYNGNKYCVNNYSAEQKNKIIINMFLSNLTQAVK